MLILLDIDSLIYMIGHANQATKYRVFSDATDNIVATMSNISKKELTADIVSLGAEFSVPDLWYTTEQYLTASIDAQKQYMDAAICKIVDDIYDGSEVEIRIYISNTFPTFRHKLATIRPYKGKRSHLKPISYGALYDHLIAEWGAIAVDAGIEADDQVCIDAYDASKGGIKHTIVHIDKDLDQIPGTHYNFKTRALYEVGKVEAAYNLYTQVIVGDDADNIQGIPSKGKVAAKNTLSNLPYDLGVDNAAQSYTHYCSILWLEVLEKQWYKANPDADAFSYQFVEGRVEVARLMDETLALLTLITSNKQKHEVLSKYGYNKK